MGLKYSSTDSANLMQAMKNNIAIANQITDRLASGGDHLISALESGELKGAAYTAGKELFSEVIIPSIKKLQTAIDDIEAELRSHQYADSVVSEYGTLDLDNLEKQLESWNEKLRLVEEQLDINSSFLTQAQSFFSGKFANLWSNIAILRDLKIQLEVGIHSIEIRIEKLKWFNQDVSRYFSDSLTVLQLAIQGATALSRVTVDSNGHYYSNGANMDWLKNLKGSDIQTFDRGTDPKISLIDQQIKDLMLPDEAATYYRKMLLGLLDGKTSSDWPVIIQAVNQSLVFDDDGNILDIGKVDLGVGNVIIVFKNGKPDEALTKQGNDEMNSQYWQSLGANAGKVLLGLTQAIIGTLGTIGSFAFGTGGNLVLSLPSGGTLTIPVTLVATTGASVSLAYAAKGTATLIDGLTQIAVANQGLQLSFAQGYDDWKANKPTSKTFGKPVEGRVNGRKSQIRVDAEPDSNNIHIQTGGGKNSPLKVKIEISEITDKNSIYKILKNLKRPEIKNLRPGQLDELVNNIWNAFKWLKS